MFIKWKNLSLNWYQEAAQRWIAYLIQFTKVVFLCYELNKQMSLGTNDNSFLLQALAQNKVA